MKTLITFLSLFLSASSLSQTFRISGLVRDIENSPLPGVNIIVDAGTYGTSTDFRGGYIIDGVPAGEHTILFSNVGYRQVERKIKIPDDLKLNITLEQQAVITDQVIISAGKHQQNLFEIPVSASVLDGRDILKYNHNNLRDALQYVSGVNLLQNQLSIRGSSGYSKGVGARVLMTLDGIPMQTADAGEIKWETVPVNQIEKVEIIKGASSSLYGSTAIGGIINVITRDPVYPITHISSYIGGYDEPSYDIWNWSGGYRMFNGQSISHSNLFGDFSFTASFTRREDEGYRKNDFNKRYIGFLKSGYKFDSDNSLTLLFNTLHQNSGNFVYWKNLDHVLEPPDNFLGETITSSRYMGGLMSKNKLSGSLNLSSSISYYKTKWTDNTSAMDSSDADQYRAEVQSTFKPAADLILVNGIEVNFNNIKTNIYGNNDALTAGIYTQTDYNFRFPLTVTAGLRFDYSSVSSSIKEHAFSPRLGMVYKIDDNFSVRANAGSGFRAPSLAERFVSTFAGGLRVKPNPDLEAESNVTLEAGMLYKSSIIKLDAALFRNDFYDMIELSINMNDGTGFFDNILRARIQGAEISISPELPWNLHLNLNYTFMESEDLDTGTPLKYRPKHLFYSSLAYANSGFETGINFRYWSKVQEIDMLMVKLGIMPDGDKRVPVYVLDLNAGYNFVYSGFPLRVFINAKNILNYYYVDIIGNIAPLRNLAINLELFL